MVTEKEIAAMTDAEFKVLENRARRMAKRQGLRLVKSRRRDPRAWDYGCYCLADIQTNGVVFGIGPAQRISADLGDIIAYLEGDFDDE